MNQLFEKESLNVKVVADRSRVNKADLLQYYVTMYSTRVHYVMIIGITIPTMFALYMIHRV